MNTISFTWPHCKSGAFTTSWDDGTVYDRELVAILNRHGIKGTFNLNSGKLGLSPQQSKWHGYVAADEVKSLYAGHEVAVHSVTHPALWYLSDDIIRSEVMEDRRALERLVHYPVNGMAYPYGGPRQERIVKVLHECGIRYSRSVVDQKDFNHPDEFLYWNPTGHWQNNADREWARFCSCEYTGKLMYLWGHSYECYEGQCFDTLDTLCALMGGADNIWYATNMEVYDYLHAWRTLQCSVDLGAVKNRSGIPLWITGNGKLHRIESNGIAVL